MNGAVPAPRTPATDADELIVIRQGRSTDNEAHARRNRRWLRGRDIFALNVLGGPSSGKTTLLERTLRELTLSIPAGVVEGDQVTTLDTDRLRMTGGRAVQINTGPAGHLDAATVGQALLCLEPPRDSVVFIENLGDLISPALFDLGEQRRVVLATPTDGADMPLKYRRMFETADVVLLNKMDLLPHVDFDADRFAANARAAQPSIDVLEISALRGDGLDAWYDWLGVRLPRRVAVSAGV